MAILLANLSVRIYKHGASFVSQGEIESALNLEGLDKVARIYYANSPYQSTSIEFLNLDLKSFSSEAEPSESFFEHISKAQQNLTDWLKKQSLKSLAKFQENNEIDVFIDLWIDQDQMEWEFSTALLLACGNLNLDIKIISND